MDRYQAKRSASAKQKIGSALKKYAQTLRSKRKSKAAQSYSARPGGLITTRL